MTPSPPSTPAPETRRGLPVKRPKGMPFSYTVRRKGLRHPAAFHIEISPDGWDDYYAAPIVVRSYADPASVGGQLNPAYVYCRGWSYFDFGPHESLALAENFASGLLFAADYARRWNQKHCPQKEIGRDE